MMEINDNGTETNQANGVDNQPKVSKVAIFFGYVLLVLSLYPLLFSVGMITGNCGTLCAGPYSPIAYFLSYIPLVLFLVPAIYLVRKSKKTLLTFAIILLLDLLYAITLVALA